MMKGDQFILEVKTLRVQLKDAQVFNEMLIRKGLSKRGLARVANIGESTALHICNSSRNPSPATAAKIAEALEVSFDEIFIIEKTAELIEN